MSLRRSIRSLVIAAVLASGCAAPDAPLPPGHAACPVCVKNCDLACVDVLVERDTPCCTFAGKTYYFCSEQCRCQFEESPRTYVSTK
jgi:hypothetical protein